MNMDHELDWIDEEGIQCLIVGNSNGYPVLRIEEGLILELRGIERLIREIAESQDILFSINTQSRSGGKVSCGRLGRSFVARLKKGVSMFKQNLPHHEVNPYVELFFKLVDDFRRLYHFVNLDAMRGVEAENFVRTMNDLASKARSELSSDSFKAIIKRFKKASLKRSKSLDNYIDALFEKHARMLVLRIDLSYVGGYLNGREDFGVDIKKVKRHWSKMQKDLYKEASVSGFLGFACKLEYGYLKGFHLHLLLFYNGSIHRQDGDLARMIGEYWRDSVTGGRGRFFNCNASKDKYKEVGIGMISFDQSDKIRVLKGKVAAYLTKIDYWVRLSSASGRSFFRGNTPKLGSMKRGRPRKKGAPSQDVITSH